MPEESAFCVGVVCACACVCRGSDSSRPHYGCSPVLRSVAHANSGRTPVENERSVAGMPGECSERLPCACLVCLYLPYSTH